MSKFDNFGYDTDEGCCVCGKKPAKIEPRFCYAICEEHMDIPPAKIHLYRVLDGKKNS